MADLGGSACPSPTAMDPTLASSWGCGEREQRGPHRLEYTGKKLGSGDQAEIEEALLVSPEGTFRPVAVKIWNPLTAPTITEEAKAARAASIQTECQLHRALQGTPGVAHLVPDIPLLDAENCLLLEVALQGDLFTIVERLQKHRMSPPLNCKHILSVVEQLLLAVEAIQALGFVHRDIKAENVLVYSISPIGIEVGLADYGHAVPIGTRHEVAGTEDYLPPSCKKTRLSHLYDGSEDLWGVGLIGMMLFGFLDSDAFEPEREFVRTVMRASPSDIRSLLLKVTELRQGVVPAPLPPRPIPDDNLKCPSFSISHDTRDYERGDMGRRCPQIDLRHLSS